MHGSQDEIFRQRRVTVTIYLHLVLWPRYGELWLAMGNLLRHIMPDILEELSYHRYHPLDFRVITVLPAVFLVP